MQAIVAALWLELDQLRDVAIQLAQLLEGLEMRIAETLDSVPKTD